MATPIKKIIIQNRVEGQKEIEKLAKQYGKLNKSVKRSADTLDSFKNAFRFAAASFGLREIVQAADQFQLLRDRIKVFVGTGEAATQVFNDLAKSARFTRTSINALAQSYNRVALATQELGLSSDQILATTVALQQTFRLSGATIAEASAATIQLSQGLSSGQLRGQELRSVLEQNAVFANLLSKELGVTRGQLIKFAESGKITSDVVLNALSKNFDNLNEQAGQLGTTISQSLTIALDAVRLKISELNRRFEISKGIETFTKILLNNIESIFIAIGALIAGRQIERFIGLIKGIELSFAGLATIVSPGKAAVLTILGLAFAIKKVSEAQDRYKRSKPVDERIKSTANSIRLLQNQLKRRDGLTAGGVAVIEKNIAKATKELSRLQELQRKGVKVEAPKKTGVEDFVDRLSKAFKQLNLQGSAVDVGPFQKLNKELDSGVINLEQYRNATDSLALEELNRKFENGKITIDQYNNSLLTLTSQLGLVPSLALGAQTGLDKVAKTAGNVALQIQQGFVRTFKTLEDSIVEFVKTGEFNFRKFTQTVLDELTRIIIRSSIIAPLAQGLNAAIFTGPGAGSSSGGGLSGGSTISQNVSGGFANGGVFGPGGLTAFANGGVVSSPTVFPFANGTGLMGEAGPEAIMPLTRRNGRLGVQGSGTVVNVINNTGGEVEQQERQGPSGEKILDIIINQKVKEAISNGSLDKQLGDTFGLRRRGN